MSKFTSALNVIGTEYHVTLSFFDISKKLPKISTGNSTGKGKVLNIEYWQSADVTVATIECDLVNERHKYYLDNGYTYSHEFKPHFTLSRGDSVKDHIRLIGKDIKVGEEYFRIY